MREFAPLLDEVRSDGVARRRTTSRRCRSCCSRARLPLPEYRLVGTLGPDHRKLFEIDVIVRGERAGVGDRGEQEGSGAGRGARGPRKLKS